MDSRDVEAIFHIRKARVYAREAKDRGSLGPMTFATHHIVTAAGIVGSERVEELSRLPWTRVR